MDELRNKIFEVSNYAQAGLCTIDTSEKVDKEAVLYQLLKDILLVCDDLQNIVNEAEDE